MKSELIVDVQPKDISIALLEDGRLMSLQREARNVKYAVGDVDLFIVYRRMDNEDGGIGLVPKQIGEEFIGND